MILEERAAFETERETLKLIRRARCPVCMQPWIDLAWLWSQVAQAGLLASHPREDLHFWAWMQRVGGAG